MARNLVVQSSLSVLSPVPVYKRNECSFTPRSIRQSTMCAVPVLDVPIAQQTLENRNSAEKWQNCLKRGGHSLTELPEAIGLFESYSPFLAENYIPK